MSHLFIPLPAKFGVKTCTYANIAFFHHDVLTVKEAKAKTWRAYLTFYSSVNQPQCTREN
jgi:hypothetical protein